MHSLLTMVEWAILYTVIGLQIDTVIFAKHFDNVFQNLISEYDLTPELNFWEIIARLKYEEIHYLKLQKLEKSKEKSEEWNEFLRNGNNGVLCEFEISKEILIQNNCIVFARIVGLSHRVLLWVYMDISTY